MNQNTARTMLLAGLATFLIALGTEITTAHAWADLAHPSFVGKVLIQLGGVGTAVWGALRIKA